MEPAYKAEQQDMAGLEAGVEAGADLGARVGIKQSIPYLQEP